MSHRSLFILWQYVASAFIGIGVYTVYEVGDALTGKAFSSWFDGSITSFLVSRGINSATLEAFLQGSTLFGVAAAFLSLIIFYGASRPRKMGGM